MSGGLDDYSAKRDFTRSPEPLGSVPRASGARRSLRFVVHRHEARQVHYDLRLEDRGVLCSWAVPKGFSYDSQAKHLAVRTEDHPLDYLEFAGRIPKGEYGAGTMTIWDRGPYELLVSDNLEAAVEAGELKLRLRGRRLRGEWHVVRTKREPSHWLLFKPRDRYAGPARDSVLGVDLTRAPEASLPTRSRKMEPDSAPVEPFSDPEWVFEVCFAGERCWLVKRGDAVGLRGRRRMPTTLAEAARSMRAENAMMDGVLVAFDEFGRPSRKALAEAQRSGRDDELRYYAFDLVHFDDFDLRPLTLLERKAALRGALPPSSVLLYTDHVVADGAALSETVRAGGLPGVVAKRAGSPYRPASAGIG